MTLIDADKFLGFLIFSKHIDSLKCKEVKEAVEMCKVDVLDKIRAEIKAEMKEYRDIDDFSKGVGYGLRSVIGIIERKTNDL